MTRHKKIIAIFFLLLVVGVLVPTHGAKAIDISGYIEDGILSIAQIIFKGLGILLSFFANALEKRIAFSQSDAVVAPPVIHQMWGLIRDFVNMFFILVLIIMAFGTIFDIKDYTFKDMFPRFLIAALLINFSFVITLYILGLSNGLAGVFLHSIDNLADRLGQTLHLGNIILTDPATTATLVEQTSQTGSAFIGSLITILGMTIFVFIAMGAIASAFIFVTIRIVVIWLLLIVSPIAWFGMTLPSLKKQTWDKWWETFISWSFFLPCYLFFVMMAVIITSERDSVGNSVDTEKLNASVSLSLSAPGEIAAKLLQIFPLNDILFFTLAIFILIGGIWASFQIGSLAANGAGAAMGFAQGRIKALPIIPTGIPRFLGGKGNRQTSWSDWEGGAEQVAKNIQEKGIPIKSLRWLFGGAEAQKRGSEIMGERMNQRLGYATKGAIGPQSEIEQMKHHKGDIERDITLGNTTTADVLHHIKNANVIDRVGNVDTHVAAGYMHAAEQGALSKEDFIKLVGQLGNKNPLLAKDIAEIYSKNVRDKTDLIDIAAPPPGAKYDALRSNAMSAVRKQAAQIITTDAGKSKMQKATVANPAAFMQQIMEDHGGMNDTTGKPNTNVGKTVIDNMALIRPDVVINYLSARPGGLRGAGYADRQDFYRENWAKSRKDLAEMRHETWADTDFQAVLREKVQAMTSVESKKKFRENMSQEIVEVGGSNMGTKQRALDDLLTGHGGWP